MEKGNKQIVEMLSLSEEINTINTKVRQLVQDLHSTSGVLINLQELTAKLNTKVESFKRVQGEYKPSKPPTNDDGSKPSYVEANNTPHRIVPTPENYKDWEDPESDSWKQSKAEIDNAVKENKNKSKSSKVATPPNKVVAPPKPKTNKAKGIPPKKKTVAPPKPPVNRKVDKKTGFWNKPFSKTATTKEQ